MSRAPHCDCLACMIPPEACGICRESKLEFERDAARKELAALREAAQALLNALAEEGRPCGACYAIATWAEPYARGGSAYRCDKHHKVSVFDDEDDRHDTETRVAAPLRALRALLETKP